ncbi:ATP-dependent Zn protease [Merismopedia glauca]|uniref:ATP-dependent Zn protease n=1 Tax=Merismopedia glauca CCAP 1448/3 TaxID=1296344 RepID=A0A2T1C1Y7_9CYAN|nr:ATP-dependent Zn protease [Merismopedia glauca]PSB02286.1 ATP-dependent Zn protease [Merismopedia glauca CCAP 1448/3]
MQKISLNLVAIAIFLGTMSILLGPFLHISHTIPAVVTFLGLGLATVDNLTWQGRGVTLLLDTIARVSPEYRQRILHHEAGHFLVAHLLGIPITGYSLSAWEALRQGNPGQGGVSFAPPDITSSISANLLQQYCHVWMAGIAAESIVYGTTEGGREDREQLQTAFRLIKRPVSQAQTQERHSILQAKTLIKDNKAAYDSLVQAMAENTPITDCFQIIEQHREPAAS